jgi:peptidoglycan hydrolase-like protein with peptidoglycan-binding domain
MRAMTRTLVSVATAVGIAAGGVAAAGTSFAAPAQDTRTVASAEAVAVLEENNLGLDAQQATNVQCWLERDWGYQGQLDGRLGTESWMAFQRNLKAHWGYTGDIDGEVGKGTVSALQRLLSAHHGYTGAIDGDPGQGTQEAFKRFSDAAEGACFG